MTDTTPTIDTAAAIRDLTDRLDRFTGDNAWEDVIIGSAAIDHDRTDASDLSSHSAYLIDGSVIDFDDRGGYSIG